MSVFDHVITTLTDDQQDAVRRALSVPFSAPHILLQGVVGSTAYGLATPDSDIDRLGIYAVPTVDLHGLGDPVESIVTTHPDRTLHEARKYCRLALQANPTVTELIWLEHWETTSPSARDLIAIRAAFLSAWRVRKAYLGYATQQFRKLSSRVVADGTSTFSSNLRLRTEKHARHLYRLLHQGWDLYRTGELSVHLDPGVAQYCRDFGEHVAAGDHELARRVMANYENLFDRTRTPLPEQPDVAAVEAWLRGVRLDTWSGMYDEDTDPATGEAARQ